jgi:hypothetical protein
MREPVLLPRDGRQLPQSRRHSTIVVGATGHCRWGLTRTIPLGMSPSRAVVRVNPQLGRRFDRELPLRVKRKKWAVSWKDWGAIHRAAASKTNGLDGASWELRQSFTSSRETRSLGQGQTPAEPKPASCFVGQLSQDATRSRLQLPRRTATTPCSGSRRRQVRNGLVRSC